MKKVSLKAVYETPRADLIFIKAETFICTSTNAGVLIEGMNEDDYEWEI